MAHGSSEGRTGVGGHGAQSAANITHYLKGIDFPASKQDLVENAKKNQAQEEVLRAIEGLPDKEYQTMAEVMHEYGEEKQQQ